MSQIAQEDGDPLRAMITPGERRYVLTLLVGAYTLSFLDRQIIVILSEAIKNDLGLTNTQLGLLAGLAFVIFYTVLGIPIGNFAERHNRPLIISASMALWSGFTVLSGFATNFAIMALARLGVGIGEAGCNPCAHSIIADMMPKEKRASALAIYSLGLPIGTMLGLALGGIIADAYGWRMAFLVAGAPGLMLALVIAVTVREPRNISSPLKNASDTQSPGITRTLRELRTKRSFWLVALATGLLAFVGYGHGVFFAPFFLRIHAEGIAELAQRFGLGPQGFLGIAGALTSGLGSLTGTWLGGVMADRAARKDKRAYVMIPALAAILSLPFIWATYWVGNTALALILGFVPMMLNALWYGPVYATAQSVVSPQCRATTAAILFFVLNLLGLGLGPMSIGALNDLLAGPTFGLGEAEGIRWALLLSAPVVLLAATLFWLARRSIRSDIVS